MSLENTKALLGADNERVEIIYNQVQERVLRRLRADLPDIDQIPQEIEYVVQEATIVRYNRIGSEGMTAETMEGHSATYETMDVVDMFEPHIAEYIAQELDEEPDKGIVRFL